jgi:hypothetical protein
MVQWMAHAHGAHTLAHARSVVVSWLHARDCYYYYCPVVAWQGKIPGYSRVARRQHGCRLRLVLVARPIRLVHNGEGAQMRHAAERVDSIHVV